MNVDFMDDLNCEKVTNNKRKLDEMENLQTKKMRTDINDEIIFFGVFKKEEI